MSSERTSEDIVETICDSISMAIAEGALRPGMKILDDVIARHFGVSRTVARGAVATLERERLIERRRNHGAFVATPDKQQAANLLEARRLLELGIVERACRVAQPEALDRLAAMTDTEEAIHGSDDRAAQMRISGNFHLQLARLAGNAVLEESLRNVVARLSLVAALYERQGVERCGAEAHRQIVKAIQRGDAAEASRVMAEHLDEIEASLDLSAPPDDQTSLSAVLAKFAPLNDLGRKSNQA